MYDTLHFLTTPILMSQARRTGHKIDSFSSDTDERFTTLWSDSSEPIYISPSLSSSYHLSLNDYNLWRTLVSLQIAHLGVVGGKSLADNVRRILVRLLTNELANSIGRAGGEGVCGPCPKHSTNK